MNRLYSVFIKALGNAEVAKRLDAGGAEVLTSKSPEEFATFLKSQNEFWGKIVKQTGATAQ
ncbi:MAG: hypothetical protein ACXW2A_09010 [Burkholderiales bacterium]